MLHDGGGGVPYKMFIQNSSLKLKSREISSIKSSRLEIVHMAQQH